MYGGAHRRQHVRVDPEPGLPVEAAAPAVDPGAAPRVRPHCRFKKRGTEHVSESGMKWMSGGATQQCGRALATPSRSDGNRMRPTSTDVHDADGCERGHHPWDVLVTRAPVAQSSVLAPPELVQGAVGGDHRVVRNARGDVHHALQAVDGLRTVHT